MKSSSIRVSIIKYIQILNSYFLLLKFISSLVIPANYNPLITALIVQPNGPAPIVNKVFKTKLNILFKIVVKLF